MKTKNLVFVFAIFVIFQGCNKKSAADFNSDFSIFKGIISNFTGGIVSAGSDIRVVLAFDKSEWTSNQVLDDDLFDISPSVRGKVVALSPNTIAFIPKENLEPDTEYQVTFKVEKIVTLDEKSKNLASFNFTLKTVKQDFLVTTEDIQSYSKDYQYLNCTISMCYKSISGKARRKGINKYITQY